MSSLDNRESNIVRTMLARRESRSIETTSSFLLYVPWKSAYCKGKYNKCILYIMVVNNAELLLPLTNSHTQVTTQSDEEGERTGSQASIKYNLLPCCLFRVLDVTNTYITLENQMIIIAGCKEVGEVHYFADHAKV